MIDPVIKLGKVLFSLGSFVCVSYTILELTYFLSFPKHVIRRKGDPWLELSSALLNNMLLLSLFIIQHSAMASEKFKELLFKCRLHDLSRSIYVIGTAATLWITMKYWQVATGYIVWNLDLSYKPLRYLYMGTHVTVWIIIYVANVCTDVTELFGLKQVYYSINNLPDPNHRKSYQLRKLTSHMRHPSFLGLVLVFWFFPVMTLDRMLLATILTAYMYTAWNTDGEDYNYQKYMYQRKYHELRRMQRH